MASLAIVSNGITLDPTPELPVEREDVPIVEDKRHRSAQLRRAYLGLKKRLRYRHPRLTEAQRTNWLNAHPWNTSFSHTDELGVTRTVLTISRRDTLVDTRPGVGGTPAYYAVEVELEEV